MYMQRTQAPEAVSHIPNTQNQEQAYIGIRESQTPVVTIFANPLKEPLWVDADGA